MKARTRRRTASSRGSNQSSPAKGDGDVAAADVASVMAWVPSRSCRSEPTPPQLFPTNLALRPSGPGARTDDHLVQDGVTADQLPDVGRVAAPDHAGERQAAAAAGVEHQRLAGTQALAGERQATEPVGEV